jgi:hypothetical protein
VGSARVGQVRFQAISGDHAGAATPHLHAFVGSGEIVIELVDGAARLSLAHGSPIRGTVTRNEVRLVLAAAESTYDRLVALWKESQPS